jgi:predicted nucleic acid-binding protein
MNQVFVDTSAFAALADKNDDNHAKAVVFNKTISGIRLVTTNYVLDELYLIPTNSGHLPTAPPTL